LNSVIAKRLEKSADKTLNNQIRSALHLCQNQFNADIYGFARWFHIKYPKQWEEHNNQWDEIYPFIKVSFDTKVKIERPGGTNASPAYPDDEVIEKWQLQYWVSHY
jgi:spore germination protein KC